MSAAPNLQPRSLPPRPNPGSCARALRPKPPAIAPTTASRPAPPRPRGSSVPAPVVALRPPPLPKIEEPEAEALEFEEEMDDTEWQDVSAFVHLSTVPPVAPVAPVAAAPAPSMPDDTEVNAFRRGTARELVRVTRTTSLFVRYLAADVVALVRRVVPGVRSLALRFAVQWKRAAERAKP